MRASPLSPVRSPLLRGVVVTLAAGIACAGPSSGPAAHGSSSVNIVVPDEARPGETDGHARSDESAPAAERRSTVPTREPLPPGALSDAASSTGDETLSPRPPPELVASLPPSDPLDSTVRPDLGGGMVLAGASAHRMILFTFDDGPHPWHTRRLLEHLARADVRGVFFVNAHRFDAPTGWYAECATVLRETAAAGHLIASHGRDHELTADLRGAALDAQVVGAEEIFLRVLGARPWLFRPPGGVRSDATDAYISARGYTQVLWTLHTGDYESRESDEVLRNFRASVLAREASETPGGIAVIHDSHPWGVAAFPRMVRFLLRRNCELLERGEELYEIVDDPGIFLVPRAAGASASDVAPVVHLAPEVFAARQAALRERESARCAAGETD